MLTKKDIKLMAEVFPTREEIVTKEEFQKLEKKVDSLTNSVDSFAKESLKNGQEITVLHERIATLE